MVDARPYYARTRSGRLTHIVDERRYLWPKPNALYYLWLRSYCGQKPLSARLDPNSMGTVCARCRKGWERAK